MELTKLISLGKLNSYKLHAARYNGHEQPLDVFIRDKQAWKGWNEWRGAKNEFNRQYILSFMDFYPERHVWLFGGIFEVINRLDDRYEVKQCEEGRELIGRLKGEFDIKRGRSFILENFYENMKVIEILRESYVSEVFPGYENISIDFPKLKVIYDNQRKDWKTALENVKGIYVICDKLNGKKYVGKADGRSGIWSRWHAYIYGATGGNVELVKLIEKHGLSYAQDNFQITLIEAYPWRTQDKLIDDRESFWKKALLTSRNDFGYNGN